MGGRVMSKRCVMMRLIAAGGGRQLQVVGGSCMADGRSVGRQHTLQRPTRHPHPSWRRAL
jgi:hypothetical protein